MRSRCEICEHFLDPAQQERSPQAATEVTFGRRRVQLCRVHAFIAAQSKVTTLGGLRHLFRENGGRRSYLPRRAVADDGTAREQRTTPGRRTSDRGLAVDSA